MLVRSNSAPRFRAVHVLCLLLLAGVTAPAQDATAPVPATASGTTATGDAHDLAALDDHPPYSVVVVCTRAGAQYDVAIAAADHLGEIMLLARASSTKGHGFLHLGARNAIGSTARITDQGQGRANFDLLTATCGSAIEVSGEDGQVRPFATLPKGLRHGDDQAGYLLLGKVPNLCDLPLDADALAQWADLAKVQVMIDHDQIIFDQPELGHTP
jgi:hypothetical protein